jgi:type I restriction enzyme S subunit
MNNPKLRFPEFSGELVEKKLGDIAIFSKGKNISKDDISDEGVLCIRYGELYTTYEEKISKVFSKTNLDPSKLVFSKENDVIIPTSGETAIDLATASCVLDSGIAIGGDTTIIKVEGNGLFISYYLNSKKTSIAKLAQGASVVHLYSSHLKTIDIKVPEIGEQEKISHFLSIVDDKLDFIEKKRDLWKTYKKGIIYQIFNQKLRFKDENGQNFPNWNEKSLFSIADIYGGGTPSTEKSDYWNGSINWFTPSEVGKDKYVDSSNRKISENGLKNSSAKLLPPGTILISSRATIGQMSILKSEGSTNQGFQSLIVNENHSNEFIYYLCHILKRELIHRASGSTFLEISKNEVGNIKIKVPTLSEQIIIANFLSSIDVKIEKIVKELEIIREFKKGLLQQIFC